MIEPVSDSSYCCGGNVVGQRACGEAVREGSFGEVALELVETTAGASPAVCVIGRGGGDRGCQGLMAGPRSGC